MKKHINNVKHFVFTHKIISIIILIIILVIGYWGYKKIFSNNTETRYVTTTVQQGTIISSITASGQVEASNQIDIKSSVSEEITYVGVKSGDKVQKGKTLFSLNSKEAQKSIRDAEINLESAKISLEKLKIQKSQENMNADLTKAYDDGFNTVSDAFLDLPGIMTGLDSMFFKSTISQGSGQWNIDWYEGQATSEDMEKAGIYKKYLTESYNIALNAYNKNLDDYKLISRTSDSATIEKLISQTYETIKLVSDAVKESNNYVDFIKNSIQKRDSNVAIPAIISTHKTSLSDYTSKTNSNLLSLLSIKTNIKSYKDAFYNADLDIRTSELSVKQKENNLQDAKEKLSDYHISAPFGGTIANITAKIGDTASGTLASLITDQKIATLSMNEVDVSKIKLNQKTTLTFDAIEDLSIVGSVAEIDTLGTASQGVVSYSVKIAFDTNDERVKPGMSVSASIIINSKTDVLLIPSSAIKTQGEIKYVQAFIPPLAEETSGSQGVVSKETPTQIIVETGISDDTNTEILSGLKVGDQIISKIITGTNSTNTNAKTISTKSLLSGNRDGGGPPGM